MVNPVHNVTYRDGERIKPQRFVKEGKDVAVGARVAAGIRPLLGAAQSHLLWGWILYLFYLRFHEIGSCSYFFISLYFYISKYLLSPTNLTGFSNF